LQGGGLRSGNGFVRQNSCWAAARPATLAKISSGFAAGRRAAFAALCASRLRPPRTACNDRSCASGSSDDGGNQDRSPRSWEAIAVDLSLQTAPDRTPRPDAHRPAGSWRSGSLDPPRSLQSGMCPLRSRLAPSVSAHRSHPHFVILEPGGPVLTLPEVNQPGRPSPQFSQPLTDHLEILPIAGMKDECERREAAS
jgi:hypothetical protein